MPFGAINMNMHTIKQKQKTLKAIRWVVQYPTLSRLERLMGISLWEKKKRHIFQCFLFNQRRRIPVLGINTWGRDGFVVRGIVYVY